MDLLERYLRQIKRYLPLKEREETIDELRSLILDQVDEKAPTEESRGAVLHDIIVDMGEPRKVAERYNERGPIISKEMEPIMLLVMKIVSITLPLVLIFADSIGFVANNDGFTMMDFFLNIAYMIPSALYALVVAIGMIFIVFALIERFATPKFEVVDKPFIPELLPELPAKDFKVSLFESIFTVLFTILLLYLFNLEPGVIGVYVDGDRYPLLNENFNKVLPFMNIGWFVSIAIHVYYLYKRKKNIASKSVEFLYNIYSAVILIMLAQGDIFNEIVIEGHNLNWIPTAIRYGFWFGAVATIIANIVTYIKMFIDLENLEELEQLEKYKK